MKFIITSESSESFKSVSDITFPIIQEYCDRHGYEFRPKVVVNPERDSIWERVRSLQAALKDCDWAVHIDADCLVTNMHIPLTEFIENEKSIVISCAPYRGTPMFNDGFCMVRGYDGFNSILDKCWEMNRPQDGIFCAQDALWRMYQVSWRDFFSVQPQKRFNSFIWSAYNKPESTPGNWTPGDFILHLPGMTTEKRVELLTRYLPEIIG